MKEIALFLENLGWRVTCRDREYWYFSPDEQQAVVVGKWWTLMEREADGGYVVAEDGDDVVDLKAALMGAVA